MEPIFILGSMHPQMAGWWFFSKGIGIRIGGNSKYKPSRYYLRTSPIIQRGWVEPIEWLLKDEKEVESSSCPSNCSKHILDAADYYRRVIRDHLRPMAQSVKSPQRRIEEHSNSAVLASGDIIQANPPFGPHSIYTITVHALDVLKMELLSQRQDAGNRSTHHGNDSGCFC